MLAGGVFSRFPPFVVVSTTCILMLMLLVCSSQAALILNEVMACNTLTAMDEYSDYPDWIEIYNSGNDLPTNIAGYGLSDDPDDPFKWVFVGDYNLVAGRVLRVFASGRDLQFPEYHTNFKVNTEGETITLVDPDGNLIDSFFTDYMPADISRGRFPDGADEWLYFDNPTPDENNEVAGYSGLCAKPFFDTPGGFQSGPISVTITCPSPTATIRYAFGGRNPTPMDNIYSGPLQISSSQVLRARCYEEGLVPSAITSASYFFDSDHDLPVVSIVTDPANLWDNDTGIYIFGDDYSPEWPYWGANFWEPWERPASVELFELDGSQALAQNIGIKIHGNYARAMPQKSLRLIARRGYGLESMAHRVFPEKEIDEFKYLILRNSGDDFCSTQFRDGFMHRLTWGDDLDIQGYRPAAVYLNGEYWGIHNIRERLDEYYLRDNHGMDPEEVDLIKHYTQIVAGDHLHYQTMLDFISANDMEDDENFEYVQTQMDTDNFATYFLYEIFYANYDWPLRNIKWWRPRTPTGRWRWMLFDTDVGFSLFMDHGEYEHDTLSYVLDEDSELPEYSTFLIQSLMENAVFRRDFINRYAVLMNTQLSIASMHEARTAVIEGIESEIEQHMLRWDHTIEDWNSELARFQEFLNRRTGFAREHVMQHFELPDTLMLSLDLSPPGSGAIELTGYTVESFWSGVFFEGNPIHVKANPASGYQFSHWSHPVMPHDADALINANGPLVVTAFFVESSASDPEVLINEINYQSAVNFDVGDWVELHNPGEQRMDLTGWTFKDGNDAHVYAFPNGTGIEGEGYLVLCEDLSEFTEHFPFAEPVLGGMDFGFSGGGEALRLFDAAGELYDFVTYSSSPPWPIEPAGYGPTLEVINPLADNGAPDNWAASQSPADHGTPCAENSAYATGIGGDAPSPELALLRPYPNPFNPACTCAFVLPHESKVRLCVYDPAGHLVATLVDRVLPAGRHESVWRSGDLPSGVYLLELTAASEQRVAKLLLLK